MEIDALILGIATIGVAFALVYATWNLYRATRSMDRRAAFEERRKLLLRKIDLAARVMAVTHDEFRDRLKGGTVPGAFLDILEMAGILEYPMDTLVDQAAVRRIVLVLREANRGVVYHEPQPEEHWAVLARVQDQLAGSLLGWYDELGLVQAELSRSQGHLSRP